MITSLQDTTILHNGVKMPWFGLGVFKVQEGSEVIESVKAAINHGYISIDTAAIYQNEEGVGTGIRESGIPREKLFVTSKVWNTDQGYDTTLKAFDLSLQKLGLDYLDLYLIHWPGKDKYKQTWKALEKLYKDGRVRAIGVSNFLIHHLQDLISEAEIIPMVNQVEYHPHLTQKELHAFCKQHQIQLEAWSPLKRGALLNEPLLTEVAAKYGKSVAQLILRWDLQNQVITIPKSIKPERIIENADIFDFEISADDMKKIDGLNIDDRSGSHPDQMEVGFTS
ncbi:aldo/keto reductase [Bacillus sp. DNRA2]|uniref:aldo/keto reductase n=1 Tax=Bacillus sp. DNRA2 TaxID=2723053 RepID=UPI00145C6E61|nr:aldo/keto reductase [Bacillus sp. DNRA2]NMD69850.1 aldo/keto reductase [Bacillus sp. DNRA2]